MEFKELGYWAAYLSLGEAATGHQRLALGIVG